MACLHGSRRGRGRVSKMPVGVLLALSMALCIPAGAAALETDLPPLPLAMATFLQCGTESLAEPDAMVRIAIHLQARGDSVRVRRASMGSTESGTEALDGSRAAAEAFRCGTRDLLVAAQTLGIPIALDREQPGMTACLVADVRQMDIPRIATIPVVRAIYAISRGVMPPLAESETRGVAPRDSFSAVVGGSPVSGQGRADSSSAGGPQQVTRYCTRWAESPRAADAYETDDFSDVASGVTTAGSTQARTSSPVGNRQATSSITGKVTAPDGTTPLQDITIWAYRIIGAGWDFVTGTSTDVAGEYDLDGLAAGTYRIEFYVPTGPYLGEVYDDAADVASGTDIVVGEGATVTGINASLALGGHVQGTVTGPDGTTPLQGIWAKLYRDDGYGWNFVGSDQTDAAGGYDVDGLAPGTYRVAWYDNSLTYLYEVYDDAADVASGTDIVVGEGATVTGINASLAFAAHIQGTVTGPDGTTPLQNISVCAYLPNGGGWWDQVRCSGSDASGGYDIGGLAAGTYLVAFEDLWAGTYSYEVYDDAADLDSGADIVVGAGTTVTGIDASLASAARIQGTVTGPDGTTPLQDIQACAYLPNGGGWYLVRCDWSDATWGYDIGGLAVGTYRVGFYDPSGRHVYEVYDDAADLDSGTDIVVGAGTAVTGIDASLSLGGPACRPYDFDCDCDIDVGDIMTVASRWGCGTGDPCYDVRYDIDPNGTVDIVDIVIVASSWGCRCGDACYDTPASADASQGGLWPPAQPSLVEVLLERSMVGLGETITLVLRIEGATDIGGFQMDLLFDPATVQVEDVVLGDLLGSNGRESVLLGPVMDNEMGALAFGGFSFGEQPRASGDGVLAVLAVRALEAGNSSLVMDKVMITDRAGELYSVTSRDGTVVVPRPQHTYLPLVGR